MDTLSLRNPRQNLLGGLNAPQAGRVVQRSQFAQADYRLLNLRRNPHSRGVTLSAMHHPAPYRTNFVDTRQRGRGPSCNSVRMR